MKGIILAGGEGTRLQPLTKVTSKQLLPAYDQPMIYYPLQTLLKAGIKDILIIVAPDHPGDFVNLLGSGKEFGARFSYEVQDKPEGIAQALIIAEDFIDQESVTLILGDNIFEEDFSKTIKSFKKGAKIFAKEVTDPERFGVVEMDAAGKAICIEEKPKNPKSNLAITGLYVFDEHAIEFARKLKPSNRGEYEIVDIHNRYLKTDELEVEVVNGEWIDAGTIESLHQASSLIRNKKLGLIEPKSGFSIKFGLKEKPLFKRKKLKMKAIKK